MDYALSNGAAGSAWRRAILCASGIAASIGVAPLVLRADESPATPAVDAASVSAECVNALKRRTSALSTASLTVLTEREYRPFPGQQLNGHQGNETSFTYLEGGKFYHRSETTTIVSNGPEQPSSHEMSFDGNIFYVGSRSEGGKASVTKYLGDRRDDPAADRIGFVCPYLEAAGFFLPPTARGWTNSSITSNVEHLAATGQILEFSSDADIAQVKLLIPEPAVIEARNLDPDSHTSMLRRKIKDRGEAERLIEAFHRLRSQEASRTVALSLSIPMGYAMQDREDYATDGRLLQSMRCEDFAYFDERKLWLPRVCTTSRFVSEDFTVITDEPQRVLKMTLTEAAFEAREDVSFRISYGDSAGSFVFDRSAAEAAGAATGAVLTEVAATPAAHRDATDQAGTESRAFWVKVIAGVNLIVILLVIGNFSMRRI